MLTFNIKARKIVKWVKWTNKYHEISKNLSTVVIISLIPLLRISQEAKLYIKHRLTDFTGIW